MGNGQFGSVDSEVSEEDDVNVDGAVVVVSGGGRACCGVRGRVYRTLGGMVCVFAQEAFDGLTGMEAIEGREVGVKGGTDVAEGVGRVESPRVGVEERGATLHGTEALPE